MKYKPSQLVRSYDCARNMHVTSQMALHIHKNSYTMLNPMCKNKFESANVFFFDSAVFGCLLLSFIVLSCLLPRYTDF